MDSQVSSGLNDKGALPRLPLCHLPRSHGESVWELCADAWYRPDKGVFIANQNAFSGMTKRSTQSESILQTMEPKNWRGKGPREILPKSKQDLQRTYGLRTLDSPSQGKGDWVGFNPSDSMGSDQR